MTPVSFGLPFAVMLDCGFPNVDEFVFLEYRSKESILKQQRFKARTKFISRTIRELLFTNNYALVAHTVQGIQQLVDRYASAQKILNCNNKHRRKLTCILQF